MITSATLAQYNLESGSDTSSYHSDNEADQAEVKSLHELMGSDNEQSTAPGQFKTIHEKEEEPPKIPEVDEFDTCSKFGNIESHLHEMGVSLVVLDSSLEGAVFDLDNIVLNTKREVIGYVNDVIGPISNPLYSVKLLEKFVNEPLHHEEVFILDKTKKVVEADIIRKAHQATDASNVYDEEIPKHEQEYSDDEKEREAKKKRKNKRKGMTEEEKSG